MGSRSLLRRAVSRAAVLALTMACACQPKDRRLLVLDLAASHPALIESTARPWTDAGYRVEYRRFYPHLTHSDLERYHALLLLGGRAPERASDRLSAGDLVLLGEWVKRGGVVVLGYPADGEGTFDRWMLNRWLVSRGVGIRVGEHLLRDSVSTTGGAFEPQPLVTPVRGAPLRGVRTVALAAGRHHPLTLSTPRRALVRAGPAAYVEPPGEAPVPLPHAAVIAASRVGQGLVIVASRHALAGLGAELRPSTVPAGEPQGPVGALLAALARWSLRPAEWAGVPPADGPTPLDLSGAPLAVRLHPPPTASPTRARAVVLPLPAPATASTPPAAPRWAPDGMRVWRGTLSAAERYQGAVARGKELDGLIAFLEAAGFNAFATDADVASLPDSGPAPWQQEYAAAVWHQLAARLQTTTARWAPIVHVDPRRLPHDSVARGPGGAPGDVPCALDPRLWDRVLLPALRAVALRAAERPDLIAAAVLDLSLPGGGYTMGHDFCDATYRTVLTTLEGDSSHLARLRALPVEARYDSLLEAGDLPDYYGALERLVARRASRLRSALRRTAHVLRFGIQADAPPLDWFSLGLLTGLADDSVPVFIWTRDPPSRAITRAYRRRGIAVALLSGMDPATASRATWRRFALATSKGREGFWVAGDRLPATSSQDSVARLLRTVTRRR